ncbi:unnamed protein product, partial [Cyprideis torosa]
VMSTRIYGKDVDMSIAREALKSEMKPLGQRGTSEIFKRKMKTLFRFSDVNQDGKLTWDDFEVASREIVKFGGLTKEEADEFKKYQRMKWDFFFDLKGVNSDQDFLTEDQYLTAMAEMINIPEVEDEGNYDEYVVPFFFKALDLNGDGKISMKEYIKLFQAHGVPEREAMKAFKSLDVNGDGEVSFNEFCAANLEYMFCEVEDKPCKEMFGPLVQK